MSVPATSLLAPQLGGCVWNQGWGGETPGFPQGLPKLQALEHRQERESTACPGQEGEDSGLVLPLPQAAMWPWQCPPLWATLEFQQFQTL